LCLGYLRHLLKGTLEADLSLLLFSCTLEHLLFPTGTLQPDLNFLLYRYSSTLKRLWVFHIGYIATKPQLVAIFLHPGKSAILQPETAVVLHRVHCNQNASFASIVLHPETAVLFCTGRIVGKSQLASVFLCPLFLRSLHLGYIATKPQLAAL
jgi:hypothetical protein